MDVKDMSTEEIENRLEAVVIEIARIKSQVDKAVVASTENGGHRLPTWMPRAKFAIRMKGIEHQSLLREKARRKKEERQAEQLASSISFERAFFAAAKNILDKETFDLLVSIARSTNSRAALASA